MTLIPDPQNSIQALIDAHHESRPQRHRPHLGCSQLGHPCDRWLWISFRWAVIPKFPGRILRLFRRGHMEEETIVSDLRAIGLDLQGTGKNQQRVDLGCHVSGSVDAIIQRGVPGAPKKKHIAEFKTHSLKSFKALVKDGVVKAKPEHHVQMQLYMHGTKIDRALYLAICKDDDRIYTERVRYDKELATKYEERGHRIAFAERMPPPISTDPSWYICRFCDAHAFCHVTHRTDQVNCRTCAHSTALLDSTWHCGRHQADNIPTDFQRTGCDDHIMHPDLVDWKIVKVSDDGYCITWNIDGKEIKTGSGGYKTSEIIANLEACGSNEVELVKSVFPGAEVVG